MMDVKYYTLKVDEATELRLRLTAHTAQEVQKKLGVGILEALAQMGRDPVKVITTVLWGASQALEHNITLEAAEEIYDKLVDNGYTLDEFASLINEIYVVSGFFKKAQGKKE
jgi:hypothetical protein